MSDPFSQPTQPLTDEELAEMVRRFHSDLVPYSSIVKEDVPRLLAEVDRLRTQSVRHVDCNAEAWAAAARVTRDLRAELDSMTQFAEFLRAERDRSVRSCGELGVELDRLRSENTAQAAKIAAAHELHRPVSHRGGRVCRACTPLDVFVQTMSGRGRHGVAYPCPSARALGVGDSGEPTDG